MSLIIIFQNTTALTPISDYRYQVLIGDGTLERSHVIEDGIVQGHTRADGWIALVKRMLNPPINKETP